MYCEKVEDDFVQNFLIEVGFKNIIYEAYSKDLSTKVKTARKTKAQQGKFITAFAPFGYLKGTKNNLVLDPECFNSAHIFVCFIRDKLYFVNCYLKFFSIQFSSLFCSGMGQTEIAKQFNKEGILCPRNIRKKRGEFLIWEILVLNNFLLLNSSFQIWKSLLLQYNQSFAFLP